MIVTIDGPAGAGKSSVARELAKRLGYQFLDTGAMYRAIAYACLKADVNFDNDDAMGEVARNSRIELNDSKTILNGVDISDEIRTPLVTKHVSFVADCKPIRAQLVDLQQKVVGDRDFVTEGRDQGTVAFPQAQCKIFLTASDEERARRRYLQLLSKGVDADYQVILEDQVERDRRDSSREVGRLYAAKDAVHVVTDNMSFEEVIQRLLEIVEASRRS